MTENSGNASHVPGLVAETWWDISLDLLAIADRTGHFTAVNPSWERVLGHTTEAMTSQPYLEFVHPDDVEGTRAQAAQLLAGGALAKDHACRFRTAAGDYRWLDWVARATPDGELLYAAARDVTEFRKATASLAEGQQFRLAMEYSASGMCLADPDGTFVEVNTAFCEMIGSSRDELVGTTWQSITHPDDRNLDEASARRLLEGTLNSYRVLKRYVRTDGATMWGDLAVGVVRNDDGSDAGSRSPPTTSAPATRPSPTCSSIPSTY